MLLFMTVFMMGWALVPLQLRIGVEPRSWHIAEPVYSHNTTGCDVVIFGGNMYKYPGTDKLDRDNAAELKILHFGKPRFVARTC